MPDKQRGKELAKSWGLRVQQALYRKTGDWYHRLTKFPGALLDADGYVIFESEEAFKACLQLRIGKDPKRHGGWVAASLGITLWIWCFVLKQSSGRRCSMSLLPSHSTCFAEKGIVTFGLRSKARPLSVCQYS